MASHVTHLPEASRRCTHLPMPTSLEVITPYSLTINQPSALSTKLNKAILTTPIEPIFIHEVALSHGKLCSNFPLVFHPAFDKKNRTFAIIDPSLGIDVFAKTRNELVKELEEVIPVLWIEYAKTDADLLTSSAQQLQQLLHNVFRESAYDA